MNAAQAHTGADWLRERLWQLTGLPVAELQTASESIPKLPGADQNEDLMARALEYSPALKGANEHAEAKHFTAKGEHKALYPSIDLAGQYGYFAKYNHFQDYFSGTRKFRSNNAVYGMFARIPIFNAPQKPQPMPPHQEPLVSTNLPHNKHQ